MNPNDLTPDHIDRLLDGIDSPDERLEPTGLTEANVIRYIAGVSSPEEEVRVRTALRASPSLAAETEAARALVIEPDTAVIVRPDFAGRNTPQVALYAESMRLAADTSGTPQKFRAIDLETGDDRLFARLLHATGNGLVIDFWSDDEALAGATIRFTFAGRDESLTLVRNEPGQPTSVATFPVLLPEGAARAADFKVVTIESA